MIFGRSKLHKGHRVRSLLLVLGYRARRVESRLAVNAVLSHVLDQPQLVSLDIVAEEFVGPAQVEGLLRHNRVLGLLEIGGQELLLTQFVVLLANDVLVLQ